MKKIVPGGYYSYDAAGKKIWLDYSYYGVGLENIDRIRNLSKNLDLYSSSGAGKPITVENGCITHSYQGTEADTDKIQVTLRTPITNSLTELTPVDGVVTLSTDGKVLVLPTENAAVLPSFNEYTLNPNRLTVLESPFGGLKSGSPDYCPGTLYTPTDGVYLTDVAGNNSTKTLTAGMLKGVNGLTVDTTAHTVTEDFQIVNTDDNNPVNVDQLTDGWSTAYSTGGTISYLDGSVILTDATIGATGRSAVIKTFSAGFLSNKNFLKFTITSNTNAHVLCMLLNGASNTYKTWEGSRFQIQANVPTTFVLPVSSPVADIGACPSALTETGGAFDLSVISRLYIGISGMVSGAVVSYSVTDVESCNGKSAYIELDVPDNLSSSSLTLQTHNGTAYQTCRVSSLDGEWSDISSTPANVTMADGTQFDHVYGAGLGRAVYPKGAAGATVNGSIGTMTYSANQGTSQRIGLRVDLPPSDNGRTNFNKVRAKLVINYAPDAENDYSASFDFADSTNTSYGLQNLSKPWIALYDPAESLIDFYLFTHRPQNMSFKRDETGTIYSLSLYPGAGSVYHGQIPFADLTLDTNSDTIPDCLDATINGSIPKFLQAHGFIGEGGIVPNDPNGDLSIALIDASVGVPPSVFVAYQLSPYTWTANAEYNDTLKCVEFTTDADHAGYLYMVGFAPATDATYIFEVGLQSDKTAPDVYINSSVFKITVRMHNALTYRLYPQWKNDDGITQLPYISIATSLVPDGKLKFSVICNEADRTYTVWFSDTLQLTVPYFSIQSRNLPYACVISPLMFIYHYRGTATYITSRIYSIEQKIPRKTITAHAARQYTAFGLDAPRMNYSGLGAAYLHANNQKGTAWADILYLSDPEHINFVNTAMEDYGWELGVHFSLKLNDLSYENACALIDNEMYLLKTEFGVFPSSWCSLTNADSVTHAAYIWTRYGAVWRNGTNGVTQIDNVGNISDTNWSWWNEAIGHDTIYPMFSHHTDEDPAIPSSIGLSKLQIWSDAYESSEVNVVGFAEYMKRSMNQSEASFTILRNTDGYLRFAVKTNGYPCTVNVPSTSAHVEIYNQSGVAVPFSTLADSVSFEVENGGEYVVIKS